ncbi:MAG TPA: copper resistance protein CopC [Micromonospora sp.]|nr:copper resistance protein CopC [Micromonospora sp.]
MNSAVSPARPSKLSLFVRRSAALAIAMIVALLPSAPASAHNELRTTAPAKDAVLQTPPDEVVLEFVERLDPKFTTIVVTDENKKSVPTSDPQISGPRGVVTFDQPLDAGTYTVAYRVVSLDGHPVQGSYSFTVTAASTPSAEPTSEPSAEPTSESSDEPAAVASVEAVADGNDGGGNTAVVIGAVAVVVLLAVGALLWGRRRSAQR